MGKTISIKVLFGIYLLLMAGKVFAFSCNVDGGSSIGAGTTSVYVNLDPVIQPGLRFRYRNTGRKYASGETE